MTAGSYMYIGPQGIVHGTTITLLNAGRMIAKSGEDLAGKLFVSSGLGGMSGAQGKAGMITGTVTVIAEVNPWAVEIRRKQGWINDAEKNLDRLLVKIDRARKNRESLAIGYLGNIVDLWECLDRHDVEVDLAGEPAAMAADGRSDAVDDPCFTHEVCPPGS